MNKAGTKIDQLPGVSEKIATNGVVEVTRTDPLEKLVWTNKKDPDNERNKILNRTKDPHPA
jgi:hypothetical protein